jgi:hypothetical protein
MSKLPEQLLQVEVLAAEVLRKRRVSWNKSQVRITGFEQCQSTMKCGYFFLPILPPSRNEHWTEFRILASGMENVTKNNKI